MVWKRNLTTMKRSILLEYFWVRKQIIDMASYGTYHCIKCNKFTDELQIHHFEHDGDQERSDFALDTKAPHLMGYYYNIYFAFKQNPDEAHKRYGTLCGDCNKKDHAARVALKKGINLKKFPKNYTEENIVTEAK